MNRFQLYELVKPILPLLRFDRTDSLCGIVLYEYLGSSCYSCPFYLPSSKGHCHLWLENTSAQQLKADIIIKHPELLI